MTRRRVVVTGLGIVSPVGVGASQVWESLLNGVSGIGAVTRFDASALKVRIAAEVRDFSASDWMPAKEVRRHDSFIHYGVAAAKMAMADAGLRVDESNAARVGVNMGSGTGGLQFIENSLRDMMTKGPERVSPFFVPGAIINMVAGMVSIEFGARGPNMSMVSSCATGAHCIGMAARLIEYGDADAMIAGGSEAPVCMTGITGFASMKALSTRNDAPSVASRPFDRDRDGFVLGEGAGVLVLEEYEHARKRGARIYAELAGMGASSDASHVTAPTVEGPCSAILSALRNAGVNPAEVDYINAHGTSTPLGDVNETRAIKAALGDQAHRAAVNATKSMHGHLLGAAGGIEAVITALAVHHQVSPPTINIFDPDPECDLDYVAGSARNMKIDVALSNSFGFGGTNAVLAFRRMS